MFWSIQLFVAFRFYIQNLIFEKVFVIFVMIVFKALSSHVPIVAVEVTVSIQRLVKKYGQELHVVAWDAVLDITEALQDHIEVANLLFLAFVHYEFVYRKILKRIPSGLNLDKKEASLSS